MKEFKNTVLVISVMLVLLFIGWGFNAFISSIFNMAVENKIVRMVKSDALRPLEEWNKK